MLFQKSTIVSLLASLDLVGPYVQAGPVAATTTTTGVAVNEELVVLEVTTVNDIVLTWYGYATAITITTPLPGNICGPGDGDISCGSAHYADPGVCQTLIDGLNGAPSRGVGSSPRAVCTGQGGNACCTSWSAVVSGQLVQSDLVPAARNMLKTCANSRQVSALVRKVQLERMCCTQCLSNRATGCTN